MKLIIFVEEESMAITLHILLEKIGTCKSMFQIKAFEGIGSLKKSLKQKLNSWNTPNTQFLVLFDSDGKDCKVRKIEFQQIINETNKINQTTIRVVCQELESWFLGDRDALEATGYIKQGSHSKTFHSSPDNRPKPSIFLSNLNKTKTIGKIARAKEITPHMDLNKNHSASFNHTIKSLKTLLL